MVKIGRASVALQKDPELSHIQAAVQRNNSGLRVMAGRRGARASHRSVGRPSSSHIFRVSTNRVTGHPSSGASLEHCRIWSERPEREERKEGRRRRASAGKPVAVAEEADNDFPLELDATPTRPRARKRRYRGRRGRNDLSFVLAWGAPCRPLGHRRATPWATGGAQLHRVATGAGAPTWATPRRPRATVALPPGPLSHAPRRRCRCTPHGRRGDAHHVFAKMPSRI
jgi:hypothetical protein